MAGQVQYSEPEVLEQQHICMPCRAQQGHLRSVSITQSLTHNSNLFSLSPNKAGLLNFLCETWCDEEQLEPTLSSTRSYVGGGFKDETKSALVTAGTVTDVAGFGINTASGRYESHIRSIYSVHNKDVERIIIHANDTDIVEICVYYGSRLRRDLQELWVRTTHRTRQISTNP